ncbi:hypothetical protein VN0220_14990 [Helicobacter pylori]|nr:hypothetical protein VN0220_14990 [Helicobacter pylori]
MWGEKIIKIIPAVVFLFCLLEIFELVLIVVDMNKTERLEAEVINNLKASEDIMILLNEHLICMDSKYFKDKKIKVK